MARVKKSDEAIAKEQETVQEEEAVEAATVAVDKVPEPAVVPDAKPVETKHGKLVMCEGDFVLVEASKMCKTYADGQYSKQYLKTKNIPCPRKG